MRQAQAPTHIALGWVLQVLIEEVDQREALLSMADKLPRIRSPVRAEASEWAQLTEGQPRAVTAPAGPGHRARGVPAGPAGVPSAAGAPEAAGPRASAAPARVSEPGDATGPVRSRLPPVKHSVCRAQAVAAAMAAIAGAPSQLGATLGSSSSPPLASGPSYSPQSGLGLRGDGGAPLQAQGGRTGKPPLAPQPSPHSSLRRISVPKGKRYEVVPQGLRLPVESAPGPQDPSLLQAVSDLDHFDGQH